jgi:hypothetical protein
MATCPNEESLRLPPACGDGRDRQYAEAKAHRGLDALAVRGLEKAAGSAMLFALTYNILRVITIGG